MAEAMLDQDTAAAGAATGDYRLGFTSLEAEIGPVDLPVRGELPAWLEGALMRTGPAQWEANDREFNHWFDGHAMLHKFGFSGGRAVYANRFLRTKARAAAQEEGISYREFATDPCRSIYKRFASLFVRGADFTDNAAVSLTRLGDRFISMTETPLAVEFDPETLETVGVENVADDVAGEVTTAHPHKDPSTGDLVNYILRLGPRSSYRIYRQSPGADKRELITELKVMRPSYIHSFGITERYLVLVEFPFVVNPLSLALSPRTFIENYRWVPERGRRFHVIDMRTGVVRAEAEADAFFAFHHINAYEDGDEIVVDISAFEDPSVIDALYLNRVRQPDSPMPTVTPRRYRVPLAGGRATHHTIAEEPFELATIDYGRRNGRPYRYAYGVSASGTEIRTFGQRLAKLDTDSGETTFWSEEGCHAGEPVFAADPNRDGEDDGAVLSVVLDTRSGRSFLLVLDAGSFEELARAEVPHHIPFGFHGQYMAGVA